MEGHRIDKSGVVIGHKSFSIRWVLLHPTRYWARALDKASSRPTGLKCIFQSHAKMEAMQVLLRAWSCMRTLRSPPDGRV